MATRLACAGDWIGTSAGITVYNESRSIGANRGQSMLRRSVMSVQIYHNSRCSKSRATLALLQSKNVEPEIVEYMKQPLTVELLKDIRAALGCPLIEMVRTTEAPYKELNLAEAEEDALLAAIVEHPILLQRPIVVNGGRAAIGRPPENVLEIL